MKARLGGLLIVVLLLAGGAFAAWYFFLRLGKLDFDKLGGTILVYEIATNQHPEEEQHFDLERDMPIQVESLQCRLDPDGRGFATVRSLGKDRVEIRIPRKDDGHAEELKRMKLLVTKVGSLEFRILANSADDAEGIACAKEMLNTDDGLNAELKERREKGLPPPGPRTPDRIGPLTFTIKLAANEKSVVSYS
ncbi:MAG: hypothetical protein EXR98_14685 [Gemmataceae bacterium]|nr:hypothetical protein [Gemmataceae bacterium]